MKMIFMCNGNDTLIVKRLLAKKIIRQCVYVSGMEQGFPILKFKVINLNMKER